MTRDEANELRHIVDRYVVLADQIKAAQDEQKELADAAYDKGLVRSANHQDARKVVKKLAKESTWDEIAREAQRLMEEALDECRAALGILSDLPLGAAAQSSVTNPGLKADGSAADPTKRSRGRPKGSRNKPKREVVGNGHDAPPPVPDLPDDAGYDMHSLPAA